MTLIQIAAVLIVLIFAYSIGAIPTAYIVCKRLAGIDIREHGSGNVGANNTGRVLGRWPAVGVMLFDMFKGFMPVLLGKFIEIKYNIYPDVSFLAPLAGLIAVIGHTKSIFINFTGGKGAATAFGAMVMLCWPVALTVAVLSAILAKLLKFKSAGIYSVAPASVLLMWLLNQPSTYILFCLLVSAYMLYLFKSNLKNYLNNSQI